MIPFRCTVVGVFHPEYAPNGRPLNTLSFTWTDKKKMCVNEPCRIMEITKTPWALHNETNLKNANANAIIVLYSQIEYLIEETVDEIANALEARVIK